MTATQPYRFGLRRATAAEWTASNPVLLVGEPGIETDTRLVKYGDGSTAWNSLEYSASDLSAVTSAADIGSVGPSNVQADLDARVKTADLASTSSGKGASLVKLEDGTNLQTAVTAKLPKSGGAMTGGITAGNSDDALVIGDGTRTIFGGAVVLTRNLTGTVNSHGFDDNTTFNKDATYAYNSFDARAQIVGAVTHDHYNGFQVDAVVNKSGGTLTNYRGVSVSPFLTAGTITNCYGYRYVAPAITAGSIGTQYGIHIEGLTGAGTNWAVYTAAPTASYFGGSLTVNAFSTDAAFANSITISGAAKDLAWAGNVTAMVRMGDILGGGSLFVRTPTLNTSFASGLGVNGSYDSGTRNSTVRVAAYGVCSTSNTYGSSLVFGTTSQATYTDWMTLDKNGRLDLNGPFGFRPAASVTPANNGDLEIEATSNTTLTFKLKGSDGTVRSGTITLS